MNPAANQRIAPNRVVLILALLLAVWLVLEFLPRKQPAPPAAPVMADSKLHVAGLADNPDWDGLPQIFAVWADHAEWKDGRTRFAYWHPVMKTYSYYFEATREGAGFRFREITEPHDPDHNWDESLGQDCPIRFYRSLLLPVPTLPSVPVGSGNLGPPGQAARPDVLKPPSMELKLQPPDIDKKR